MLFRVVPSTTSSAFQDAELDHPTDGTARGRAHAVVREVVPRCRGLFQEAPKPVQMIRVGSFAPFQHLVDELYKAVLLVELVTGGSDDERLLLLAKSGCFGAVGPAADSRSG